MAIDSGSGNTTRYYSVPDHADFTLPNGDWAWITLAYPQSSTDVKYIISTGAFQAVNSVNLLCYNTATGDGFSADVSGLSQSTFSPVTHDSWYWAYVTRRSGTLFVGQVPILNPAGLVESAGRPIGSAYNSTTGPNIGRRSDGTANRYWKGRWGQVAFVSGSGITSAQAVELARGSSLLSMPFASSIKALWHGRTANDSTIAGIIGEHVATRQGASYGTSEEDAQTPYLWIPQYVRGVTSSGGGVSGSVATTNADDVSVANAAPTVTASSATTNADDISNAVVGSEVSGTVAVTNADDTSAATASPVISASSGTTNADDVSSAAASPVVSASAANTNADDISDASAAVGSEVVGSVAYTNIDDASSATLKATITASVAVTNSDDISSAFSGAVVDGSVAVTNADDVSVGSASPVVSLSSATTNADDISSAEAVAETGEIIAAVDVVNADDISSAVAAPVITASIAYSNLHDLSAAIAEINFGTIVEALLTTGLIQDSRIKKPGIPSDAPEWQRTMFEIFTGRRGNKIDVAKFQTLTFSATPTQAECEALYSYINEVRQSIDQLTKRFDS